MPTLIFSYHMHPRISRFRAVEETEGERIELEGRTEDVTDGGQNSEVEYLELFPFNFIPMCSNCNNSGKLRQFRGIFDSTRL